MAVEAFPLNHVFCSWTFFYILDAIQRDSDFYTEEARRDFTENVKRIAESEQFKYKRRIEQKEILKEMECIESRLKESGVRTHDIKKSIERTKRNIPRKGAHKPKLSLLHWLPTIRNDKTKIKTNVAQIKSPGTISKNLYNGWRDNRGTKKEINGRFIIGIKKKEQITQITQITQGHIRSYIYGVNTTMSNSSNSNNFISNCEEKLMILKKGEAQMLVLQIGQSYDCDSLR